MDGLCAAYLGMTPAQVDECSFRDINTMLTAVMERGRQEQEAEWQRSLVVVQAIENAVLVHAGKRPLPLDYRFRKKKKAEAGMPLREYRKRRDRALKALKKRGNSS